MQVEIGNYDSFYERGVIFSPEQVQIQTLQNLTKPRKRNI